MDQINKVGLSKESIDKIPKQELVRFISQTLQSDTEIPDSVRENLLSKLSEQVNLHKENSIPVSIFNTDLPPLEAIVRFLRESQQKGTNEIARLLCKKPASVSEAYRNSKSKEFKFKSTDVFIPILEFQNNPDLSVLEVVVTCLRSNNLKFKEIANLLGKDPKTVWTCHNRAKKKNEVKNKEE